MDLIPRPLQSILGAPTPPDLPVGLPISLTELPIVRAGALRYEGGKLAPECLQTTGTLRIGQHRVEYQIGSSDPEVPLPYGNDAEIIYAAFEMGVQDRIWEGENIGRIVRVPIERFKQILGVSKHGDFNDRVRGALQRFSVVGVHTVIEEVLDAEAIASGSSDPRAPRARLSKPRHVRTHILTVAYQEDGTTIDYIQIDPTWVRQLMAGDAAWVHLPIFTTLGPIGQRLYSISAAHTARGQDSSSYTQEELIQLCGIGGTPSEQRRMLKQHFSVLAEQGIVEGWEILKERPGQYRVQWNAGPTLSVARLLRGAGLADLEDARIQLLLLAAVGISGNEARQMLREAPDDALWALYYYCWVVETQGADAIKSPRAYLRWAIKEGRNLAGEVDFYAWYRQQTERPGEAVPPSTPIHTDAAPTPLPTPEPFPDNVWGESLRRIEGELPQPLFALYLRPTALLTLTESMATVGVPSDMAKKRLEEMRDRLEGILSEICERPVALSFVVTQPPRLI